MSRIVLTDLIQSRLPLQDWEFMAKYLKDNRTAILEGRDEEIAKPATPFTLETAIAICEGKIAIGLTRKSPKP